MSFTFKAKVLCTELALSERRGHSLFSVELGGTGCLGQAAPAFEEAVGVWWKTGWRGKGCEVAGHMTSQPGSRER